MQTKIAPILRVTCNKSETFWKVEAFVVVFSYKLTIAFTMYKSKPSILKKYTTVTAVNV